MLPHCEILLTLPVTLRCLVQVGVVASGASYFGAFLPVSILALYLIQKYYLRTSRQMRLLDLEAKTPLYTQFTEITAGLATIRSFGWTNEFLAESFRMLNTSQKPFYLMFCIQRWLELVLDLFVAGMAILLVTIALRIPGTTSEGAIGLAMVNLLGLNMTLTTVIDQWTTLETSLGAIARLKSFISDTPNENKSGETEVPYNWPRGRIVFDGVTASYRYVTACSWDSANSLVAILNLFSAMFRSRLKPGKRSAYVAVLEGNVQPQLMIR